MKVLQRVAIVIAGLAICISLMTAGAAYPGQIRNGVAFIYTGLLVLLIANAFSDISSAIKNNGEVNPGVLLVGSTVSVIGFVLWLLGFVGIYIGIQ